MGDKQSCRVTPLSLMARLVAIPRELTPKPYLPDIFAIASGSKGGRNLSCGRDGTAPGVTPLLKQYS